MTEPGYLIRRERAERTRLEAARAGTPSPTVIIDRTACTCGSRRMQAFLHTAFCAVRSAAPNGLRRRN